VLLDAVCSTGSNSELVTPMGGTGGFSRPPRGLQSRSPDKDPFGFARTGRSSSSGSRFHPGASIRREEGMLGAYALHFGDGYMIHGTPFKMLLGNNVTHGCVRMETTIWRSSGTRPAPERRSTSSSAVSSTRGLAGSLPPSLCSASDRAGRVCVFGGPGEAAPRERETARTAAPP